MVMHQEPESTEEAPSRQLDRATAAVGNYCSRQLPLLLPRGIHVEEFPAGLLSYAVGCARNVL